MIFAASPCGVLFSLFVVSRAVIAVVIVFFFVAVLVFQIPSSRPSSFFLRARSQPRYLSLSLSPIAAAFSASSLGTATISFRPPSFSFFLLVAVDCPSPSLLPSSSKTFSFLLLSSRFGLLFSLSVVSSSRRFPCLSPTPAPPFSSPVLSPLPGRVSWRRRRLAFYSRRRRSSFDSSSNLAKRSIKALRRRRRL